jgi:glyoxylase-like metal-dependent hydrolase (beta-lactamase superfamily II)
MSLEYPFPDVPAPGTTLAVVPGIHWLSMPLPFEIAIGKQRWRAFIGHGHAPEHLSLFSKTLNAVIAGDMLLSTIARYRELPDDVLVLPSHGKPFRGAHRRVEELDGHHRARLGELTASLREKPQSAAELFGVLFRRPLDTHQTFFAMGEAIAHLHYLYYAGRAQRALGNDGIMRYAASG